MIEGLVIVVLVCMIMLCRIVLLKWKVVFSLLIIVWLVLMFIRM